ncbi:MAG: ABC transporter permease subunit [Actinomycetota bacterium]|nr:ABC transporter permease subunit [Actinomycetota bacterium]
MTVTSAIGFAGSRTGSRRAARAFQVQAVRWGTVLVFVVVWQYLFSVPFGNSDYIAPPSKVATVGLAAILEPANLLALWQTTSRFLQAFAIAAVLGVVVGLALGRLHRQIFSGARDVVTVLYALPMVPFYPLFVLWLGLGMRSEVAFGAIHGIFPVILITMSASAAVDTNLVASGDAMGATAFQRLRLIILPAILPEVLGALKIGAALSLLGVLLGELMISVDGIGSFITNQITNHGAAPLNAMILVVCVGVVVINAILSLIERQTSRWRS